MKILWKKCEKKEAEIDKVTPNNIYIIATYIDFINENFGENLGYQAYREYFSDIIRPS